MKTRYLHIILLSMCTLILFTGCGEQGNLHTFSVNKKEEKTILFESLELLFHEYTVNEDTNMTLKSTQKKPENLPSHTKILSPEFSLTHDTQFNKSIIIRYTFGSSLSDGEQDASHIYCAVYNGKEWEPVTDSYVDINKNMIIIETKKIDGFIYLYSEKPLTNTVTISEIKGSEEHNCLTSALVHSNATSDSLNNQSAITFSLFTPLNQIKNIAQEYILKLPLFDIRGAKEKNKIIALLKNILHSYSTRAENEYVKTNITLSMKNDNGETEYSEKQFSEKAANGSNEETLNTLAENMVTWVLLKEYEYIKKSIDVLFTTIDNGSSGLSYPVQVPLGSASSFISHQDQQFFTHTFYFCVPGTQTLPEFFLPYHRQQDLLSNWQKKKLQFPGNGMTGRQWKKYPTRVRSLKTLPCLFFSQRKNFPRN